MTDDLEVRVRPATVADLEILVELATAASAEIAGRRGGPQLLRDLDPRIDHPATCRLAIDDDDVEVLCGTWQGFVCGYGVIRRIDEPSGRRAVITELFTAPEVRDLGMGEELVATAISWATRSGCGEIDAHVLPGSREAKNLFERSGLVARQLIVSRRLTEDRRATD